MSASGKKKTTMAKLARESRLRERRLEKQVRKDARRLAAVDRPTERLATPSSYDPESRPTAVGPDPLTRETESSHEGRASL